jgi:hypothetical protein
MPGTESLGRIGYGTKVFYDLNSSPPNYIQIPEVVSVTPPGRSRPEVDITHLDSPDESFEYTRGLKQGKVITIRLWKTAATLALVETLLAEESFNLRVVYAEDAADYRQTCEVVPIDDDGGTVAPNDPMETTLQLRISGPITTEPNP